MSTSAGGRTSRPTTSAARPGTSNRPPTAATSVIQTNPSVFLCISEARKREMESAIAIAAMNIVSGECSILFFKDSLSFSITLRNVLLLHPGHILLFQPETNPSKLFVAIGEQLSDLTNLNISHDRKAFNQNTGREIVETLGIKQVEGGILSLLEGPASYYVFTAIAALFDHIMSTSGISFKERSIMFKQLPVDGTMMIDFQTARCLELVENSSNSKSSESLFGTLNHCATKMGSRYLRASILQPLTKTRDIQHRQDAILELLEKRDLLKNARTALVGIPDLDYLISSLIQIPKNKPKNFCEQSINRILLFKQVVKMTITLKDLLGACKDMSSRALLLLTETLQKLPLDELMDEIDRVIDKDVSFQKSPLGLRNQRSAAVKGGFDGLLDVARQTYKEASEDVNEAATLYAETYSLPIKLAFAAGLGYYLTLSIDDLGIAQMPEIFINIVRKGGKSLHFTTLELTCLNQRMNETMEEIYCCSEKIISNLLVYIHSKIFVLYSISESVAILDMISSLAAHASQGRFCIPEFTSSLALQNGRHPILERSSMAGSLIPNDVYADSSIRLQFLTGPNMSGKSTYLNQIALLQVMAQIGSHLPAEYASIRICDQLLTRIGYDDSVVAQISSFSLEMKECAFLLEHVTDNALVIIDELGRGTSTSDAVALSIAIAESILSETKAFIYFSTHFDQVCKAFEGNPHAAVLQMKTSQTDHVSFAFKAEGGTCSAHHYGIDLARKIGFPESILIHAMKISTQLEQSWLQNQEDSEDYRKRRRSTKVLEFAQALSQVRQSSTLSAIHLRLHLIEMQKSFSESLSCDDVVTLNLKNS